MQGSRQAAGPEARAILTAPPVRGMSHPVQLGILRASGLLRLNSVPEHSGKICKCERDEERGHFDRARANDRFYVDPLNYSPCGLKVEDELFLPSQAWLSTVFLAHLNPRTGTVVVILGTLEMSNFGSNFGSKDQAVYSSQ